MMYTRYPLSLTTSRISWPSEVTDKIIDCLYLYREISSVAATDSGTVHAHRPALMKPRYSDETVPACGPRHDCAIPSAPLELIALASKRLSCQITRVKNSTGRAFSAAGCSKARQTSSAVGTCADPPRGSPAVEASLSSGGAGVALACSLADAFAKASAQASSGPAMRSTGVSF